MVFIFKIFLTQAPTQSKRKVFNTLIKKILLNRE